MALNVLGTARSGIEATAGSAITCTRLLYFNTGTHDQAVGDIVPSEIRDDYNPTFRAYPGMERNSFTFSGDATYDDLAFWFRLAVHGGTAVVPTGATADKTWTFAPTQRADDLDSATIEFAYADLLSNVGWRVPGCKVDEFTLDFEVGKEVTWTAKLMSFKAATQITSFSGSLSDRTNVTVLGTNTQTSIDTTTIGSTADSNIMSVKWSLKNNLTALETLNNSNTGSALLRPKPRESELTVRRYFADKTELNQYLTKSERKIRTKALGPTLGASNYTLQLDNYGYWSTTKTADASGLIVADMLLKPLFDSGVSADFGISLVNSLATIS